ncbi:hypothetical protein ACF0H5_013333 [Mactra antiquata]
MARFLIIAILFEVILICYVYGKIYKKFKTDIGVEVNTFYETTTAPSITSCAAECVSDPCQTATYDDETEECRLSIDTSQSAIYTGNPSKRTIQAIEVSRICDESWESFNSKCYFFGVLDVKFEAAEEFCQSQGGHLVSIHTTAEKDFIRGRVIDLPGTKYWIGLTDVAVEGVWVWIDTDEPADMFGWYYTQPNEGRSSNCGGIWDTRNYQWVDEPCDKAYRPICKK